MGFCVAVSHGHGLSSSLLHAQLLSSSSSKSTLFTGFPLLGKEFRPRQQLLVYAKRVSGLDEALRIRRERDLQGPEKFRRPPPLRRGKVSPRLPVPDHIPKPPYLDSNILPEISSEFQIHDAEGIARMRAAGELAARVLNYAGTLVRPSVTTDEIDKAVHQMIIENGDIINIDVTVYLNGYHGDTSRTFLCGDVSGPLKRLVQITEECLEKGIAVCKDGTSFKKIGKRISEHAEKYGYGVVERFVGHGVGTVFHSEPIIFHHRNDGPGVMVEGQTFTIEPILTLGGIECTTWPDNWTTLTSDGSPAAQFEHTILITRTGAEILTKCEESNL